MWVRGRLTKEQVTTRPGNIWPEQWSNMSKGSQRYATNKWAKEKPNWTLRENSEAFTSAAGGSSSGRPVATEYPSSEKNVHLHPIVDGAKTSGSSTILQTISICRAKRSTNFTVQHLNGNCARFAGDPTKQSPNTSRSTLRSGANSRATAYGLHLGRARIMKT